VVEFYNAGIYTRLSQCCGCIVCCTSGDPTSNDDIGFSAVHAAAAAAAAGPAVDEDNAAANHAPVPFRPWSFILAGGGDASSRYTWPFWRCVADVDVV